MLKNFLIIAYRNLFKYKYYSIINILSFAIGLAVFVTAYLYVVDQLSYDKFNKKSDSIFRVVNVYEKDSTKNSYASNPFPMAAALKNEFPEYIECTGRIFNLHNNLHLVQYNNKRFTEKNFYYVDSTILNIFDIQLISGDSKMALKKPGTVIISEKIKEKYFGDYNPIGKEIIIDEGFPIEVVGVFKDLPAQSHIHFDILTPISTFFSNLKEPDTWLWNFCWTYITVKDSTYKQKIEKEFPGFVNKYFDEDIKEFTSLNLQAITDIHLKSDLELEVETNSKSLYIYILLTISVFLVFVSWLNFINLSIVGSITRIREISIRKIMGSSRRIIVYQFLVEAILFSLISFLASLFIIEGLLPLFTVYTGHELQITRLWENHSFFGVLLFTIFAGVIVGIYTGLYASSFPTFNVGRFKYQLSTRKWFSGKTLIMIQYIISLILLIAVFINFKQLTYLKNTNLGFSSDRTIILHVSNNPVAEDYEDFKEALLDNQEIENVTGVNHIIGSQRSYRRYFYTYKGMQKVQSFPELIVRHDFIKTLNIRLIAGSDFIKGSSEDVTSSSDEIIINESMVRYLGYKSNEAALHKRLSSFKGEEKIIGVIKDFNTRSLHKPVSPIVIRLSKDNFDASEETRYIIIKFKNSISAENIKIVAKKWLEITPNWPFEYKPLDQLLDQQYRDEESLNFFLWVFSLLIILIGSMGVWAVSSLLSIQRTKEIGIRKAIGASIPDILKLFLKDFTIMLVLANIIAWPISWILLDQWFKNFANHIELEWRYFFYASIFILLLTLAILTKHALKVARSNTVDSLRDE